MGTVTVPSSQGCCQDEVLGSRRAHNMGELIIILLNFSSWPLKKEYMNGEPFVGPLKQLLFPHPWEGQMEKGGGSLKFS